MSVLENLWLVKELGDDCVTVICNGEEFSVPKAVMPKEIREGDVLALSMQNGDTLKRKEELLKLFKSFSEK